MTGGKALKKWLPELALGVLLCVCLLLVGLIHRAPGLTRYAYAPYSYFILQPEEVTEETIPTGAGVRRSYTFTIPEGSVASIGARIPFPEELRHTRSYLAVEAIRYGDRLSVAFDTRHTAFRLPALTLQPLVENAVKHSLGQAKGTSVQITVSTRAENGWSVITVSDNGPGLDTEKAGSAFHIGLQNVRERLRMMSGGSLELQSAPAVGTTVTVRLPPPDMGGNGG